MTIKRSSVSSVYKLVFAKLDKIEMVMRPETNLKTRNLITCYDICMITCA